MASKQSIIDGINKAGIFYLVEIDKEDLSDFDIAAAIVQKLGEYGLNYLAENSDLMSKRRQWRRLQDIAKSGIIDIPQNNEVELDELTEGLEEGPSPWDALTEGLEEAPSPWDALTEGLEEAPSPWDELTEGLEEAPSLQDAFTEELEEVDFRIGKIKEELSELRTQLEQMVSEKSSWLELAKLEIELSNKEEELEYFESIQLRLFHTQIQKKENELEEIRNRNKRLSHYQEKVNDIDRSNGLADRSPFEIV